MKLVKFESASLRVSAIVGTAIIWRAIAFIKPLSLTSNGISGMLCSLKLYQKEMGVTCNTVPVLLGIWEEKAEG